MYDTIVAHIKLNICIIFSVLNILSWAGSGHIRNRTCFVFFTVKIAAVNLFYFISKNKVEKKCSRIIALDTEIMLLL